MPSPAIADIEIECREPMRGAVKAVARHQHHAADAGRGRGAAGFGDAGHGKRGRFRRLRALFQHVDRRHVGIEQIEIGEVFARSSAGSARPANAILRRRARHGDRAFGQRIDAVALMSLVDTTACLRPTRTRKPEIVALGALRFLDRAVAHLDRQRHRAHRDGIGRVGAGAPRGGDQALARSVRADWSRSDDIGGLSIGLWGGGGQRKMCA